MLFLSLHRVCPIYSDRSFSCVLLYSITSLVQLAIKVNPIQRIAMTHECLCVLCFSNLCCSTVNPFQGIAMTHECLCVLYLSNLCCSTVNPFQGIAMAHECLCVLCFSNLCCSRPVIFWSGLSEIILSKKQRHAKPCGQVSKILRSANRQIQSLANTACSRVKRLRLPLQV